MKTHNENLNCMANTAHHLPRKATKNKCFEILEAAIKSGAIAEALSKDEAAQLYSYFLPAAPKKPKTLLDWIAKAMAKNDVRYYLRGIYSDGETLVATDGHRMHLARGVNWPKGFYDAQGNSIEIDGTFPQFERVLPSKTVTMATYNSIKQVDMYDVNGAKMGGKQISRVKLPNQYTDVDQDNFAVYCYDYLADVLSNGQNMTHHCTQDRPSMSACLFTGEFDGHKIEAVVMPQKV